MRPIVAETDRPDQTAQRDVALLYPGDRTSRDLADPTQSRFASLFAAFAAAGVNAEPAIYSDDFADEVSAQLRNVQVVLAWCNPIEGGRRREGLDAVLRDVAHRGVFVSAHPDTILRLGTKDILFETRDLPFGSDVYHVDSLEQLAADLPVRLRDGARVIKQQRGHNGIGVWRVESIGNYGQALLKVREAKRASEDEVIDMPGFLQRLSAYFEPEHGGHLIDQAWQPGLTNGMIRAYLVEDKVVGFGHQAVNALVPALSGGVAPQPSHRIYHGPDMPEFQALRQRLESDWIQLLCDCVDVRRELLPLLWDCDFMVDGKSPGHSPRFVLCEVNVSSVSPYPPSAIAPLVEAVKRGLARRAIALQNNAN